MTCATNKGEKAYPGEDKVTRLAALSPKKSSPESIRSARNRLAHEGSFKLARLNRRAFFSSRRSRAGGINTR